MHSFFNVKLDEFITIKKPKTKINISVYACSNTDGYSCETHQDSNQSQVLPQTIIIGHSYHVISINQVFSKDIYVMHIIISTLLWTIAQTLKKLDLITVCSTQNNIYHCTFMYFLSYWYNHFIH